MVTLRSYAANGWLLVVLLLLACDKNPVGPAQDYRFTPGDVAAAADGTAHAAAKLVSAFTASAVSWSEIDLAWPNSASTSGYQIFRSTTGATGSYTLLVTVGASATTYANFGLTGSTEYCYQIRSFKAAGRNTTYGSFSAPTCATTLAPPVVAPSETEAIPQGSSMVLVKWKDNSSDESGFRIERASLPTGSWTPVNTALSNVTSQTEAATAEQQSCFRVIAFNSAGPSLASAPDCTSPPAAPSELSANATDQQSLVLAWSDNSAVEDGYGVSRRDQTSGSWSVIATLPSGAVSYRDATVTVDKAYDYRVQALKDGGYSDNSNEVTGIVPTNPPQAPVNAHAFFDYGDHVPRFVIWWTDFSADEAGFRIEFSNDGVTGWSDFASTHGNVSEFRTETLPPSGCYRVIAFNIAGASNSSNVTCAEPTSAPSDLTATTVDHQSVDLAWNDDARLERGYAILISAANENCPCFLTELPANSTSYRVAGLESEHEYFFYVVTMYDDESFGEHGNYSNVASATTLAAPLGVQSARAVPAGLSRIRVRIPAGAGRTRRLP